MHKIKSITAAALIAIAAIGLTPAPSSATVSLNVDALGQLTGAMNVNVGGTLYDVTFRDGTCFDLFTGCNDPGDFAFTDQASALQAAQALLDSVLLDGGLGNFDTDPTLTTGCEDPLKCLIHIPFSSTSNTSFSTAAAQNATPAPFGDLVRSTFIIAPKFDLTVSPQDTFALFSAISPPAAIPEPGTWLLYLVGFALLAGFTLRRRA